METTLIIIIVGLAFAYLLRKFSRSLQRTGDSQCGCGCTSCPNKKKCDGPVSQSVISSNWSSK